LFGLISPPPPSLSPCEVIIPIAVREATKMGCFSCAGKSSKNDSKKKPDDQIPSSSGISMKDAIKLENLYFFLIFSVSS
jgi:hypothetical protein